MNERLTKDNVKISVVLPAYREAENLRSQYLPKLKGPIEAMEKLPLRDTRG